MNPVLRLHSARSFFLLALMVIAGLRLTSGVSTPLWAAASVSELVPIYTIQGNGAASPLAQQWVDVGRVERAAIFDILPMA